MRVSSHLYFRLPLLSLLSSVLRQSSIVVTILSIATVHVVGAAEPPIVIESCIVFDVESEKMVSDQTIVIRGTKIQSVTAPDKIGEIPNDAVRIDGRGKFVIPGLIDAHTHVVHVLRYAHMTGDTVLPLYLAAGVTSIRSTGDELVAETLVARHADAHPESSPRVFTCSPLIDGDPVIHKDIGYPFTDPSKAASLFDDLVGWDVRTVKIYAGSARPVGRSIIDEGKRRGIFVTAHLGAYSAQDAVADGINGIEHITSILRYVIPNEARSEPGFPGSVNLNNTLCDSLIADLVKHKTYVDPTLTVFRNRIILSDIPDVVDHPDMALVPRRLREYWPAVLKRDGCPQGGALENRQREFAKLQELTGRLYRAGVLLQAGTDSPEPNVIPGYSMHVELELLVESGLPPAAALRAATLNNATVLGEKDRLGSVTAGKQADLVLLDANPLENIKNTRRIEKIIRAGRISSPAELLMQVPKE